MPKSFALLVLTALAGCATDFEPRPLPVDHPANAQAEEAPRSGTRRLIAADELSRRSEMQLTRKDVPNPDFESGGMSHHMSEMPGMDHSNIKEMPPPAASATASAADTEAVQEAMKKTSAETKALSDELKAQSDAANGDKSAPAKSPHAAVVYTCTMHPEVNLPAPGKCPKCGMTLVKKEAGTK